MKPHGALTMAAALMLSASVATAQSVWDEPNYPSANRSEQNPEVGDGSSGGPNPGEAKLPHAANFEAGYYSAE
jgi:hypothetical protein